MSNNGATKFADWVAYKVIHTNFPKKRSRNWKKDQDLPSNKTLEKPDYTGANAALKTDRGHQAPLGSFSATPHWALTNYLSNITPQKAKLNQGPWKYLETVVREYSEYGIPVYVMTGPLFERNMPALPQANEPHTVPSGYWKVLATLEDGVIWTAAFIMDQNLERDADFCDHSVSIATVETRTGLDFFHELSSSNETEAQSGVNSLNPWLGCW